MKILTLNTGSSSLKFTLYQHKNTQILASGTIEKIKTKKSIIRIKTQNDLLEKIDKHIKSHKEALKQLIKILTNKKLNIINNLNEIQGIGHRIVHGGPNFKNSVILNENILSELEKISALAPLHNPTAIKVIEITLKIFPNAKQVLCFDTSWHQTMNENAFLYATPYSWYKDYNIRKYGFHGLSYAYITKRVATILNKHKKDLNLIILHLGNGSSINAVKKGISYDTSMGLTPLEGLAMGTRSGDIDPAIIPLMSKVLNKTPRKIEEILNKESGMLGISLKSNDLRDIWEGVENNEYNSKLAVEIMAYRIKKYIGSYLAILEFNIDAIVFTAGIGVTDYGIRELSLKGFEKIGIEIDLQKNNLAREKNIESDISSEKSKTKILVIPTNEELTILEDTYNLITEHSRDLK
ncbi:acetate kinase [Borrelia hermsii]|uniref:Acetate kinase n=3 Tax=Borrelia hermsii TaxID=140 RepID=ACKA_BORHD|nr:acetate kinase [Borrelia hermsii]B2S0W8.1 RecName: Full=Acetate kinase; AltName: Full=Acetokinase [Borrelia hermsii DAH]AAX17124.1 acetate kinase [Borrelia hermsii DAH]AJW73410.1 acetate kinase [Borrelia hermsii CC1]AMR75235.1 Acetate kinase [Borrelia hermsii]ANA43422.1 acetate kinase [Borrelia hermsii HS1]UCP01626.1 acetate kinase [Borrelia hermsii]